MRGGLRALADALGDGVYLLGCGLPSLPAVGLCHGNRVGHDLAMPRAHQALGHPVDERWTGFMGVRAGGRNLAARWAHIDRWYDADADVVMAWGTDGSDPAGYGVEEARVLATMAACSGGPYLLADELGALGDEARAVLEHPGLLALLGAHRLRPLDVMDRIDPDDVPEHAYAQGPGIARLWSIEHERGRALAIFNWGDAPVTVPVPDGYRGASELWTGARVGDEARLPPRSVRVLLR
jgi:alpha-galactosidase